MNKIEIYKFPFYEFDASKGLTDRILQDVKTNVVFEPNMINEISKRDKNYFDEELFDWFDSCLQQVKQNILVQEHIQVPIVGCWVNKTTKLKKLHSHNHPNSFLSGSFYLTTNNSGHTIFYSKNYWLEGWGDRVTMFFDSNNNTLLEAGRYQPQAGKLLIFPSCLTHGTLVSTDEERYSIAFNTFLEGSFGNPIVSTINLRPVSVRELYKK
jgi:hypothetical protein